MFKKVLIPTDGSALARKAAKAGVSLARELGASVVAYHAVELVRPYIFGDSAVIDARTIREFEKRAREAAQKYVDEIGTLCERAGVPFSAVLKADLPHAGIIAAAKKEKCDVIFIGSHGHGELKSLLLGSVTQKVLAQSKIPVLVFR